MSGQTLAAAPPETPTGPRRAFDLPARVLRSLPRAAWICAILACLNAACWSVITPPFESPDEPSHFAYTQQLAETGRLPTSGGFKFSPEEEAVVRALHQGAVAWHPEVHTISSPAARRALQLDLSRPLRRSGPGDAGVAAAEPPLYYALETIPYYLGSGGTLLVRLELMRLLSSLMAGVTALFVFMFVRELLPSDPRAWTVGGLGAALVALLGSTSGAVTPDAMLAAVCAAIFYCLARAFRRGLTRRLGIGLGALIATGFLTKLNFFGLVPGLMLGLVVLGFRGIRTAPSARPRRAFGAMALAAAIAIIPVCLYVVRNLLTHRHALGIVSSAAHLASRHESLFSNAVYVWDFYLPRLPGTLNYFPGLSTIRQLWFDRAVGLYGWLDTGFPIWVYKLALIPAGLIVGLTVLALVKRRVALRARTSELLVYLVMSVGLMALIATDAYLHRLAEGTGYAEPRYLLPLLPLASAILALATRGAGRRLAASAGALIVVLVLAQDLFSQLLVVARFYG